MWGCDRAGAGLTLIIQHHQGYSLMYSGPPCSGLVQQSLVPYFLVWGTDGPLRWLPCDCENLAGWLACSAVNSAVHSPSCPSQLVQGLRRPSS